MASPLAFSGQWVLVTGASAGLGRDIARELARTQGCHLLLTARRADRLEALCAELRTAYGIQALPLAVDLTRPGAIGQLLVRATLGRTLAAAVLNAGVTWYGETLDMPEEAFSSLLSTNVSSVVSLSTGLARHMRDAGTPGALLLVSSLASLMPIPFQAAYAGTKAFITSYGLSLAEELKPHRISVSVFAPGGIATEMLELSGLDRKFKPGQVGIMSSEACAKEAVSALVGRKAMHVPGSLNQLLALSTRLLPRSFLAARSAAIYRPSGT